MLPMNTFAKVEHDVLQMGQHTRVGGIFPKRNSQKNTPSLGTLNALIATCYCVWSCTACPPEPPMLCLDCRALRKKTTLSEDLW